MSLSQQTEPGRPSPRKGRKRSLFVPLAACGVGLAAAAAVGYFVVLPKFYAGKAADILTYRVKLEPLPIAVVEKGTLESAENRDVVCKVKAGAKGTFASTIRWVIDDGTVVTKGQLLCELDDSALQEQHRNQSIVVDKARAEFVKADEDNTITVKQNESDIASAISALKVSELDFDKFLGFRGESGLNMFGAVTGAAATLLEKGEYKQKLDDVSGRLKQAESDLEAYRERSAWAERSVKLGYLTPSQGKVEITKMAGGVDTVEKLTKEKYILENFTRQRELTDLRAKHDVARIGVDKATLQARAKEVQAESERKTKNSVYQQELDKLQDIDEQIGECKAYSPSQGMVVYYKPDSGRFGGNQQGMIAQGEQVKEGQKLMRIPDPSKMQVNTKVHEALVSRIVADERRATGMTDSIRAAMLVNPDPLTRFMSQSEYALGVLREKFRDKEYELAKPGQTASIRVDAFPDKIFPGRVRSVAAVASQADWFSSDVKVYQTLVVIEGSFAEKLKPDMNAEVTIHIDTATEPVLAVPIQAVVGGAEAGPTRVIYVMTPAGAVSREVTLGKFNDKMIEVRKGLAEGDEIVLNPKALPGEKGKTREEGGGNGRAVPNGGGDKGGDKSGGDKKAGGKGKGGGKPPAGGLPPG